MFKLLRVNCFYECDFFSSLSSSVMVKVGSRGIYLENVCKSSSKYKEQNFYSICSLKVFSKVRKILRNIKVQTMLFHIRFEMFCQIQQIQSRQQDLSEDEEFCEIFRISNWSHFNLNIMNEIVIFLEIEQLPRKITLQWVQNSTCPE